MRDKLTVLRNKVNWGELSTREGLVELLSLMLGEIPESDPESDTLSERPTSAIDLRE